MSERPWLARTASTRSSLIELTKSGSLGSGRSVSADTALGARPEAPVDVSEQRRAADEAERLAQKERVAAAGGQLLTAALVIFYRRLSRRSRSLKHLDSIFSRHYDVDHEDYCNDR